MHTILSREIIPLRIFLGILEEVVGPTPSQACRAPEMTMQAVLGSVVVRLSRRKHERTRSIRNWEPLQRQLSLRLHLLLLLLLLLPLCPLRVEAVAVITPAAKYSTSHLDSRISLRMTITTPLRPSDRLLLRFQCRVAKVFPLNLGLYSFRMLKAICVPVCSLCSWCGFYCGEEEVHI